MNRGDLRTNSATPPSTRGPEGGGGAAEDLSCPRPGAKKGKVQNSSRGKERTEITRAVTHTHLKPLQQLALSRTHRFKQCISPVWTADRARNWKTVSINLTVFIMDVTSAWNNCIWHLSLMWFIFSYNFCTTCCFKNNKNTENQEHSDGCKLLVKFLSLYFKCRGRKKSNKGVAPISIDKKRIMTWFLSVFWREVVI